MSRTVSARIPKELHEELREKCNKIGCNISDYVMESIKFAITGSTDFDFDFDDKMDNESIKSKQQMAESKKENPIKIIKTSEFNKPRMFDCINGFLYENGTNLGKCSDFVLKNGRVYDKNGNFMGNTKSSLMPKN